MKLKKLIAQSLVGVMALGMVVCGSDEGNTSKENKTAAVEENSVNNVNESNKVSVETVYGTVEVPSSPKRICVLDIDTMDIIDTLGLGDTVVCLAYNKKYPDYLESYYTSETIISLSSSNGHHGEETEEVTDPYEVYYTIDADMIIGTNDKIDEELYKVLCQIAPTVVLENSDNCKDGMYAGVMKNSATIASIWNAEEKLSSVTASYDDLYEQLKVAATGKTYILGSGDTEMNSIMLSTTSENSDNQSEKNNDGKQSEKSSENNRDEKSTGEANEDKSQSTEYSGKKNKSDKNITVIAFLTEIGMVNVTEQAPEEVRSDALEAAFENGTAKEEVAKQLTDWIESVNPDALLISDRNYSSLEEVRADGYDYLYVDTLSVYKNGGFCFLSTGFTQVSGGLTAMMTTIDQMTGIIAE